MRLIDADALIEFCAERWIPLNIDAVNMQPTIQPEKAQLSQEGTTSDLISRTETVEHLRRVLEATVPNTDYDEGYIDGIEFGISTVSTMPTIQPQSTTGQLNDGSQSTAQSTNLIDRQAAIDAVKAYLGDYEISRTVQCRLRLLPTVQPELAIPLSWIDKYTEWLHSLSNVLADQAEAHISVMLEKWRDEQNE